MMFLFSMTWVWILWFENIRMLTIHMKLDTTDANKHTSFSSNAMANHFFNGFGIFVLTGSIVSRLWCINQVLFVCWTLRLLFVTLYTTTTRLNEIIIMMIPIWQKVYLFTGLLSGKNCCFGTNPVLLLCKRMVHHHHQQYQCECQKHL